MLVIEQESIEDGYPLEISDLVANCAVIGVAGVFPGRFGDQPQVYFNYQFGHSAGQEYLLYSQSKFIRAAKSPRFGKEAVKSLVNKNFILEISWYDGDSVLLHSTETEVLIVSHSAWKCAERYRAKSQTDIEILDAIYSSKRFVQKLNDGVMRSENIRGSSVFVSGYGAAQEIGVLCAFDAGLVYAHDTDASATALAREYFKEPIVTIVEEIDQVPKKYFDFVISRHVVEHVPLALQSNYIRSLIERLKIGGKLILEFPNGSYPIDPHTNVFFFHLFPSERREYLFNVICSNPIVPPGFLEKLRAILTLNMPTLDEVIYMLPEGSLVVSKHFTDPYRDPSGDPPQTIELKIERTA